MRHRNLLKLSPRATYVILPVLLLLAAFALTGCHSPKPAPFGPDQIDNSWIIATESCWPSLARNGYNVDKIRQNLADPANFRSTFPTYSAQTNSGIQPLLTRSVGAAPAPDISKLAHSSTPILNRGQAAEGTSAQNAAVSSTNGIAPPDALCAVQPGTPAGFR